ncbi:MAG: S9 family peptidase, partial [Pseudomonadota bacterium]
PVFCRRAREAPEAEQVLLDGDALAEGRAFLEFGAVTHSPDHAWLAYTVDVEGAEQFQLVFRNLSTGEELQTEAQSCAGDLEWANDSHTVFFTERDEELRPSRVFSATRDGGPLRLVYEEADPAFFIGVDKTSDHAFILIVAHQSTTSEVRVIDAARPDSAPRLIAPRERDVEYDVDHWRDTFFIRTNADGAEDFKIVTAPDGSPGRASWADWAPAAPGVLRLGFVVFAGHLARLERADARPRIVITDLANQSEHEIAFDEAAYDVRLRPGYEFETATLRFGYSSPSTPSEVYDYDMDTRARTLVKRQEIPSGHNPSDYVVERLDAPAHDGETIPVTVLRRCETPTDGTAPLLLYGYGSYGHTIPAGFSSNRLSLVDRGFVYAIAQMLCTR